jgi:hypothetical protein
MIPEQYQGLGMPNFALISLALKLWYLQCNWGFGAPHSNALMIGYESFIIEAGLYDDTMGYKYKNILSLQRTIPGSKMCGNWFLILTSTSISMKISS